MGRNEGLLIAVSLSAALLTFILFEPVPQWVSYHDFSDSRTFFGTPNALNVFSNFPFLLFGVWGIAYTAGLIAKQGFNITIFLYSLFFFGVALVAFGSGYYHLQPSNETLVWDRAPMTVAFMALLSAVIAELVSERAALRLVPFFIMAGLFSVFYWHHTEQLGHGDLRLYGLVQFLPFVLIAMILFLYERPASFLAYLLSAVACYVCAKLLEHFDAAVYELLGTVSGHSLKHVFASGTAFFLLLMLYRRSNAIYARPTHNER